MKDTKQFRLFCCYAKQYKSSIFFLTLVYILSTAFLILAPQALRGFIDSVYAASPMQAQALAIGLYLAAMLAQGVMSGLLNYQLASVGQRLTDDFRRALLSHYLSLDAQRLSAFSSGEMLTRLNKDAEGLFSYYYVLLYKLAGSSLVLAGILAMLLIQSLWLAAALALASLLSIGLFKIIQDRGIPKYVRRAKAAAMFNGYMKEVLDNSPTLRALGAEKYAEDKTHEAMRQRYRESFPANLMYANLWSASTFIQGLVVGTGLLLAAIMWDSGSITLGMVYLIYTYSDLIITPLMDFRIHMGRLQESRAGILRTQEFLDIPLPTLNGGQGRKLWSGDPELQSSNYALSLTIEKLTFSYDKGKNVLRDINFRLKAGEKAGIMGETGCGKSTLLSLIARLNSFDNGVIALNGVDIRSIDAVDFRKCIAYATQQVQLIHGTVRDNITFFGGEYADGEIIKAIKSLGLDDWLGKLDKGLDTVLELGEANLSSGEAQLISLVRLFLRNPGLVLLDEISSSLDPVAEEQVIKALKALCENKTVVAIAHRREALSWMDSIYRMKDGILTREGNI